MQLPLLFICCGSYLGYKLCETEYKGTCTKANVVWHMHVGLCDKKYLRSASFTNLLDDGRSTGHLDGTPTF